MKIPTSSSILLASLAISSSSGALAAPTSDGNQGEGGLSPSPSRHHPFSQGFPSRPGDHDTNSYPESFDSRDIPLLDQIGNTVDTLPIVGPLLRKVVSGLIQTIANSPAGSQLAQTIPQTVTPELLRDLEAAAGEVSRRIANSTAVPGQAPGNQTYPAGGEQKDMEKDKDGKDKEQDKDKEMKEKDEKDKPKDGQKPDDRRPDDKEGPKGDKDKDKQGPPHQPTQQQAPPRAPPPTNTNQTNPPPTATVHGKDINTAPGSPARPGNPPNSPAGSH